MTGREMLRELLASGPGKAGVVMLAVLIALSVYVLVRFPLDFGTTRWANPAEWSDNPKAAPPVWSSLLGGDRARHREEIHGEPADIAPRSVGEVRTYAMGFDFEDDLPPTFFTLSVSSVSYHSRPPVLSVVLVRPDGEVVVNRQVVRGPREGEQAPFTRFQDQPLRIAVTTEASALVAMNEFFQREYGRVPPGGTLGDYLAQAFVSRPDGPQGLALLPGPYTYQLRVALGDRRDEIGSVRFVVGGSAFGLMGTDSLGRDLALGLAFGLPVALFIGIVASVTTTVIGATLGTISGYMGGKTDMLIQRISDIVANVPLLPLLIFLVFVFGSNLFLIMLFLVAFSWPGLTILIRSMVLQIRSGHLIESAVALGASKWRIMLRHVFPHTAPFVFAQMIFFAPAAILAEAGLSFLGLGDPSIPTWGQILEQGFRTGAVYLGFWWWVIPPGALIVITAVTFMLLSLGMEPVVNPRLRRSR